MCGIIASVMQSHVGPELYDALTVMQHRGQDAAGIMTCAGNKVFLRKANGLVRDAVRAPHMRFLKGNMGLGHVRYPTAGSDSPAEAQPFYVNSPYGLAVVHNGNLINADALGKALVSHDLRHLNTDSDSEVLLNVFAYELATLCAGGDALTAESIFKAVARVHQRCKGAYAVAIMVVGYGIVAFRDPHAIRPLLYGTRTTGQGVNEYMVASESIVLDALGYRLVGDVLPGEAVYMDLQGGFQRKQCAEHSVYNPCIFEYIYLARPDSIIDGISVYDARLKMGETLGEKIQREFPFPDHPIDVVVPVPDTSCTAAMPVAQCLGVPYREGIVKNRYIGRTFIMPGQAARKKSVQQKLNLVDSVFRGKNVLLVDDSIVRGTTSRKVVEMVRQAGAARVYFASVAPEVRYPNVYGIDMPVEDELVARQKSVDEIKTAIGADWLVFQALPDLQGVLHSYNAAITGFEHCIFTGDYITGGVDDAYLARLQSLRSDTVKNKKHVASESAEEGAQIVAVHNSPS